MIAKLWLRMEAISIERQECNFISFNVIGRSVQAILLLVAHGQIGIRSSLYTQTIYLCCPSSLLACGIINHFFAAVHFCTYISALILSVSPLHIIQSESISSTNNNNNQCDMIATGWKNEKKTIEKISYGGAQRFNIC